VLVVSTSPTRRHRGHPDVVGRRARGGRGHWALDDAGTYAETAHVTGGEVFEAAEPFPVRVTPRELVAERTSRTAGC